MDELNQRQLEISLEIIDRDMNRILDARRNIHYESAMIMLADAVRILGLQIKSHLLQSPEPHPGLHYQR